MADGAIFVRVKRKMQSSNKIIPAIPLDSISTNKQV